MFYAAIFFIIVLLLLLYLDCRKPRNFPPGPKWYPIIGSALIVQILRNKTGMLCKAIEYLANQYKHHRGVISVKIGKNKVVFAVTSDAIRELYMNDVFDGRPTGIFYDARTFHERLGILFTETSFWQEQKRFLVRHLKDFGFAKRGMFELIETEANFLLDDMKKIVGDGCLFPMQDAYSLYVLNTLWSMLAGIRYNPDNLELKTLQELLNQLFGHIDMTGALFGHFPLLRFITPDSSGYTEFVELHKKMYRFFGAEVDRHKAAFKIENEPRDFIDVFLKMMYSPENESFTEKQLLSICLDMFVAGSETTTKVLNITLLYLVREQEIQRKVQEEIDNVIGRERLPRLEDRINMPYCESVTLESLRMFMACTFGIPHSTLTDTKLCGYNLPKHTTVIPSFRGLLLDENIFADPHNFRPERFLKNGKISIIDKFIPFGVGNRRCMGEMMGKANVFLFMTTLIQNFNFLIPDGETKPTSILIDGATPKVGKYNAKIVPR